MKKVVFACLVTLISTSPAIVLVSAMAQAAPSIGSTQTQSQEPQLRGVQNQISGPAVTPTSKPYSTTIPETAPAPALQGMAKITDISASARSLSICPLTRNHDKNLKYVEVKIKNEGAKYRCHPRQCRSCRYERRKTATGTGLSS